MRKLMGCVVLVAGVGALGWYGSANTAETLQTHVAQRAATVASTSVFDVQTAVSGRDIAVTGVAQDQAEFDTLQAAFNDVEGRRAVDMSAVTILPLADPFEMMAIRNGDGTTLSGVIGGDEGRALVAAQVGDVANDLVLSSGRPDDAWADVAARGLAGLAVLKSGEMTLSGRTMTLTGIAATPTERDGALGGIGELPDGYELDAQIAVEDDGTPLRLMLTLRDGVVSGGGKVPASLAAIAQTFDEAGVINIVEAGPALDNAEWDVFAQQGAVALAALDAGVLTIDNKDLTLTGTATPRGIAVAQAALTDVADGYSTTVDLVVTDDGLPFRLMMEFDGATVTADGKYPAGYRPDSPNAADVTDSGRNAFLVDDGAFTDNAAAGIAALGLLENGILTVTADEIILTGLAATRDIDAAVARTLQSAAGGVSLGQNLAFLDDGSPANWAVEYTVTGGGEVSGKLPRTLSVDAIADAMGVVDLDGDPFVALVGEEAFDDALAALGIASEYLLETERLSFATSPEGATLDIVLSPGVNADLVAADLAERLPGAVQFSAAALVELPEVGAIRTNRATMQRERFQFGNWLPILTFAPIETICRGRAEAVLGGSGVNFLPGSAQLDAKSVRAINALSSIAQRCINEGNLRLEVGGHTDDTGSVLSNDVLSNNRAEAVRIAMLERGVDAAFIIAVGYGQSRPIARNETEDGRAANRRTEFTWSQRR